VARDTDLAREVAEHLLLGRHRPARTEQRSAAQVDPPARTSPSPVRTQSCRAYRRTSRVQGDRPTSRLSLRQLERRVKGELRCSVLQHYRQIRMAKAHQLLQQTELSVTDVALSCGFSTPEYFCQLYRAFFHCSPSHDRRQSTTAPVLRLQMPQVVAKGRSTFDFIVGWGSGSRAWTPGGRDALVVDGGGLAGF